MCAMLPKRSEAAWAIPNWVQTKENKEAHATISMMPPVVFAESMIISHISLMVTSRYTTIPTNRPYTTDTAAASVGVKIPP